MREIKFEYILLKNDVFIGKEKLSLEEIEQKNQNEFCYDLLESDEIVIKRQYTGLKDKNDVDIYEGDIVIEKSYPFYGNASEITDSNQKCDELNYVGVIVWDNGYYVDLKAVSDRVRGSSIGQSLYDYEELEIIGNIYETPELLN